MNWIKQALQNLKIPEPCQPIKLPNLALGRLQLTKNRLATPDTDS